MIAYNEYCKRFCEIEYNYNLFDLEFNDHKFWKYARYYLHNILHHKLFGVEIPFWFENKEHFNLPQYNKRYQRVTDMFFHNPNIGCKNKDILLFSFARRVKTGKKFVSPVTDEIALHLEHSHCVVDIPYCGGYYRPTILNGIKYFDIWKGIGEKSDTYVPMNRGELRKQILCIFEREFDIKFTPEEKKILLTRVNHCIMYRDELMAKYKRLISMVKPKVVLYTVSYISEWVILTETLKEMGIPGIEILHSYIDDTNVVYNYAKVGLNDSLPDYIFTYSQIQKDTLKWGIPKDHIRVVGNPWLERKKEEFLIEGKKGKKKKTITFISSANQAVEKYMVKLADYINQDKYEIIFKLHPEEYTSWRTVYRNLPDTVRVIDNSEKDIHFYLANSDFVIGITSTALFEAAAYPADIFILEEQSWQSMHILLQAGRAFLVHNVQKLYSCIMNSSERKRETEFCFYEENAMKNINMEIEKIIREGEKGC